MKSKNKSVKGKKIIIANWKMNLSIKQALDFIKKLKSFNNKAIIAAPYTFLPELAKKTSKIKFELAAQDVSQFEQGAYTGEVSAKMLKEVRCAYCVVGHSERRIYFKETDQIINQKIKRLLEQNIKPILCIGETDQERKENLTKKVLRNQLKSGLKDIININKILIAYEPVWAISTFQKGNQKQSAEINDINEAHLYIKTVLTDLYGNKADKIKVLYGGTVKPQNSQEILSLNQVDGALVGSASLKISSFNAILKSI
jgi:triosephosphate isomerase